MIKYLLVTESIELRMANSMMLCSLSTTPKDRVAVILDGKVAPFLSQVHA